MAEAIEAGVDEAAARRRRERRAWLGALAIFAASRLIVLFAMGGHLSDIGAYLPAALEGAVEGRTAYADFWFPYPPLALAPVYLPALLGAGETGYALAFRLQMALFDLLALGLLVRLLGHRMGLAPARVRVAILAYALLGLALGDLLYDRLDLVLACVFLGLAVWAPDRPAKPLATAAVAWAGILFKLAPLFWLPLVWLAEWSRRGGRPLGFLAGRAALHLLPPAVVLWWWDRQTGGGLFRHLGEHAERGIEIESLWATPVWLWQRFAAGAEVPVVTRWGGQHLAPWLLADGYVWLSKYAGFALLAVLYAWLARRATRRPGEIALSHAGYLQAAAAFLLLLIASQRVLSPQYLIWALPGLSALLAIRPGRGLAAAVGLVYLLTFELFSRGYWQLAAGETWPVLVLTLRNAVLAGLAVWLLWRAFGELFTGGGSPRPAPRRT